MGVGAVILHEGRLLLIQRGQEPLKGEWSLPGGAVETGETLEEALVREVFEETGLNVQVLEQVGVFDRISRDEQRRVRYHYVLIDYLCTVIGGALRVATDAAAARWVRREEWNSHGALRIAPFTICVIEKAWQIFTARNSR